ncbi:SpoIIAA-like [Nakamurella panacisegetis]|uniref:SpoIIAA-like n=1 Tax=Nakamurella panacisegetis TaxID=1090615 RepID=A0A1H0QQ90_9ACTN|nr:STAS/SEC14 domain-containing protein [Nakamurella panacisegetis]SDP19432.1 SpoIIAA-like [Nakamurella panacisegetis]
MDETTDSALPCRVWWDEENQVAHNDWLPGSVCDLAAARRVTAAVSAFGRGPVPVLVDMRFLAKADRAAREHFTSPEAQATAVALLVASAVSKVVANFVISVQRMPVPVRMFTDEASATTWLREQRE